MRMVAVLGAVGLCAGLCASPAVTQDLKAKPTYGEVTLKAGFSPDPYEKKLEAGGPIQTKLGGVTAWISKAPDFQLNYTAGGFALTIHAASDADTTLLVNLPDPAKEKGSPLVARTIMVHWSFDSFGRKVARERTVPGDDVWVTVKYPDGRGVTYYGTLVP